MYAHSITCMHVCIYVYVLYVITLCAQIQCRIAWPRKRWLSLRKYWLRDFGRSSELEMSSIRRRCSPSRSWHIACTFIYYCHSSTYTYIYVCMYVCMDSYRRAYMLSMAKYIHILYILAMPKIHTYIHTYVRKRHNAINKLTIIEMVG